MGGWIKIHTKLLEWQWYDDTNMVRLWLHCLLKANYKDKKWHGKIIPRGSFVTSYNELSEETGLSVQTVRTCIDKLKESECLTYKPTSKFSIVTISNYDTYQVVEDGEQQAKQQSANKQNNSLATSSQQATNTLFILEEDKNSRIIEDNNNTHNNACACTREEFFEVYGRFKNVLLKAQEYRTLSEEFGEEPLKSSIENLSCKLIDGNTQSENHYATLTLWLSYERNQKKKQQCEVKKYNDGFSGDPSGYTDKL